MRVKNFPNKVQLQLPTLWQICGGGGGVFFVCVVPCRCQQHCTMCVYARSYECVFNYNKGNYTSDPQPTARVGLLASCFFVFSFFPFFGGHLIVALQLEGIVCNVGGFALKYSERRSYI